MKKQYILYLAVLFMLSVSPILAQRAKTYDTHLLALKSKIKKLDEKIMHTSKRKALLQKKRDKLLDQLDKWSRRRK